LILILYVTNKPRPVSVIKLISGKSVGIDVDVGVKAADARVGTNKVNNKVNKPLNPVSIAKRFFIILLPPV
jgi:hypothetical protein